MSEEKTLVNYSTQEGIAVIALSNPPANSYSYEMMRQIDEAVLKARFDDNIHVIVIRGEGEKFFCAGADINMLAKMSPRYKYFFCLHANETLNRLEHTPKLVIAAINGNCVGGGLEVALAADIRIARKDSGRIGLPEVALGVLPGTGGTQRLARLLGKSKSIEIMTTGNLFSFQDALELGLVNQLFSKEDFWTKVIEYARQFCPPNKASLAVGHIKRSVQSGLEMSFEQALVLERELQAQLFASQDAKEGLDAYVGKRVPKFEAK